MTSSALLSLSRLSSRLTAKANYKVVWRLRLYVSAQSKFEHLRNSIIVLGRTGLRNILGYISLLAGENSTSSDCG